VFQLRWEYIVQGGSQLCWERASCIFGLRSLVVALALPAFAKGLHLVCLLGKGYFNNRNIMFQSKQRDKIKGHELNELGHC
jgi:hypothetical protein